jgi:hypothetical protein
MAVCVLFQSYNSRLSLGPKYLLPEKELLEQVELESYMGADFHDLQDDPMVMCHYLAACRFNM